MALACPSTLAALAFAIPMAAQTPAFSHRAQAADKACLSCHSHIAKSTTVASKRLPILSKFNHQKHLGFWKNPCVTCHHGIEQSEVVTTANFPKMTECVACHNQIDPPFSCEFCHDKGARLKPASHTPDYLDAHNRKGANLDKATCAVCHGKKFTCLGCH